MTIYDNSIFKIIILSLSFGLTISYGQNNQNLEQDFFKIIENYRGRLLDQEKIELYNLKNFITRWDSIEANAELMNNISFSIASGLNIYKKKPTEIVNHLLQNKGYYNIASKLTLFDLDIIKKNFELLRLIQLNILEREYPHRISANNYFLDELFFYDIQDGETIAEIGSGTGMFSLILYMLYKDNTFYCNEIKSELIKYANFLFDKNRVHLRNDNFRTVKGSTWNPKLKKASVDKIIIRNSFHHFENKQKMLKNISKALTEDGQLYIMEYFPGENPLTICHMYMERLDIMSVLELNNFKIVDEFQNKEFYLLKYMKIK